MKRNKKQKKQRIKDLQDQGVNNLAALKHVNGLPIPENTLCSIMSSDGKIEITANGTTFNLPKSKITDICLKTDVEIKSQYVSSAGGAIGGAMMFGAVGAMIGGRTKEKKKREYSTYLIFTYSKDDTIDYIGFEATHSLKQAKSFVDEWKQEKTSNKVIDL